MTKHLFPALILVFSVFFSASTLAAGPSAALSKEDAIRIISTLERLNERHYQAIHISDGTQRDKDGFQHHHAKKISFFGPRDPKDTSRNLRHCTMLFCDEYGWYIQQAGRDARGFFLEISSQLKGRVFVR